MAAEGEILIPIDPNDEVQQKEAAQAEIQLKENPEFEIGPEENPCGLSLFINMYQEKKLQDGIFSYDECLELRKAAKFGDMRIVERLQATKGNLSIGQVLCYPITKRCETALHIAAVEKKIDFVDKMLRYVEPKDLELKDINRNNAFHLAAAFGAKLVGEKMLNRNPTLLRIPGGRNNMTPLYLAARFGQSDMADYLYEKYGESEVIDDIEDIFFASMRSNLYDLAIKLLDRDERLYAASFEGRDTALHMLAKNPSAFTNGGKNSNSYETKSAVQLLARILANIKVLGEDNVRTYMDNNEEIIFDAANCGNSQFLEELINIYPDLVLKVDDDGQTIFHIALWRNHVSTFNLIRNIGFFHQREVTAIVDYKGNNLLHLAARLSNITLKKGMVPGEALRMQQELRFFEEVESLVMPEYREMRNNYCQTPWELFTEEHKKLMEDGEEWMKKTAESCILVATIVATVAFAAAFTLPGDYDENGIPRHLKKAVFSSFIVADAVTVSSASISILQFLSIFTSRFDEEDFRSLLPLKLMAGVLALFISIACMMVTFSLNFFLAYSEEKSYMFPILIFVVAFGPVLLFLYLQRYLLKETLVQVGSLLKKQKTQ